MKNDQDSKLSLLTIANANGNTLPLAVTIIATSNTPVYFPYKNVPAMVIIGLQYLNPSMMGLKDQKTKWKTGIMVVPPIYLCFHCTMVPGLEVCNACMNLGNNQYDSSQSPNTILIAFDLACHAF